MVVETPLAGIDASVRRTSGWRELAETTALSKFVCEGISVARLSAKGSEKADSEDRRSLEIALTFASARHEDKDIAVLVELVRGGEVLATTSLPEVEVEEGGRATRQVKWKVKSSDLAAEPAGMIRVTVTIPGVDNLAVVPRFVAAPAEARPVETVEPTAKAEVVDASAEPSASASPEPVA